MKLIREGKDIDHLPQVDEIEQMVQDTNSVNDRDCENATQNGESGDYIYQFESCDLIGRPKLGHLRTCGIYFKRILHIVYGFNYSKGRVNNYSYYP